MARKFNTSVSIRDCRSIYVTYASAHLDLTQLYELSRQMCHSFQMQQTVYRSEGGVERAMKNAASMQALTGAMAMPIGNDGDILTATANNEDSDDASDEFDSTPDDLFMQVIEEYNASHDQAI
jgi:hypothetical protein